MGEGPKSEVARGNRTRNLRLVRRCCPPTCWNRLGSVQLPHLTPGGAEAPSTRNRGAPIARRPPYRVWRATHDSAIPRQARHNSRARYGCLRNFLMNRDAIHNFETYTDENSKIPQENKAQGRRKSEAFGPRPRCLAPVRGPSEISRKDGTSASCRTGYPRQKVKRSRKGAKLSVMKFEGFAKRFSFCHA